MTLNRRTLLAAAAAAPLALHAQQPAAWPARPIRLLVGYAPGGSVDMAGRITADLLQAKIPGATVVVENLPGAAGTVAAQRVVQSPPDGYTLLAGSSNELCATAFVNPAQKYDPNKDLSILGVLGTAPVLLVASPKVGVRTLDEFITLVKKSPGRFSYGSSGVGSTLHFAGELIKQRAGLFLTHIPYRGTAPLLTDLVAGNIEFAMMSPTAAAAFIRDGRLLALGITSAQRSPVAPGVPALAEHALLKGYELNGWFALAAPRGLPADIAERLRAAIRAGLQDAALRKRFEDGGAVPASGREDVAQLMRTDSAMYAQLVRFANIRE